MERSEDGEGGRSRKPGLNTVLNFGGDFWDSSLGFFFFWDSAEQLSCLFCLSAHTCKHHRYR